MKAAIRETTDAELSETAAKPAATKQRPRPSRAKLAIVKSAPPKAPEPEPVDIERIALAALLEHLGARGFAPLSIFNGEYVRDFAIPAENRAAVIVDTIMAAEQSTLMVQAADGNPHGIFIVPGNGPDLIGNWSYDLDDADGFNAAMVAFDEIANGG